MEGGGRGGESAGDRDVDVESDSDSRCVDGDAVLRVDHQHLGQQVPRLRRLEATVFY